MRHAGVDPAHVEIKVRVNAILLELRNEVIEPVELSGIERLHILAPDTAGRREIVHVMEADAIDAELRHARGDLFGVIVRGETRAKREIHAEDPEPAIACVQVAIARGDVALSAGRAWIQVAHIRRSSRSVIPWKHKGEKLRVLGANNRGGDQQGEQKAKLHGEEDGGERSIGQRGATGS